MTSVRALIQLRPSVDVVYEMVTRTFGQMIRRKIEERKSREDAWPLITKELLTKLDTGPLPELFNAIYFSFYQKSVLNQYGYAASSHTKASKSGL